MIRISSTRRTTIQEGLLVNWELKNRENIFMRNERLDGKEVLIYDWDHGKWACTTQFSYGNEELLMCGETHIGSNMAERLIKDQKKEVRDRMAYIAGTCMRESGDTLM